MISEMMLKQLSSDDQLRIANIQVRWRAYYGQLPKPLKVKPGKPDDNIRLNKCGFIVDKGVSFLFGDDMNFSVDGKKTKFGMQSAAPAASDDGEAPEKDSPEQKWLENCWDSNKKMTLLTEIGLNGGVCGHTFIRMMLPENILNPFPRLVALDPQSFTLIIYDQEDYKKVTGYVREWNAIDNTTGKMMARRQTIQQDDVNTYWSIKDEKSVGDSRQWQLMWPVKTWPYIWGPIFHCQNLPAPNEFWGRADIEEDIVEVNTSINFNVSNINRILCYHAHPKTWGSGFAAKELNTSPDSTIIFTNPLAKLANLEMTSDLTSSLAFYKILKDAIHEMSQMPEITTGKVESAGPLSGVALDILYRPVKEKTGKKKQLYGDMLSELNSKLLEVGEAGTGRRVENSWPNTTPQDVLEEAQAAVILESLGVSKDTLITQLGFDANIEAAKKAQERTSEAELGDQLLSKFDNGSLGNSNPGQNNNGSGGGGD